MKNKIETKSVLHESGDHSRVEIVVNIDGQEVGSVMVASGPLHLMKAFLSGEMSLDELWVAMTNGKRR